MIYPRRRGRELYCMDGQRSERVPRPLSLVPFILAAVILSLAIPFTVMDGIRVSSAVAEKWMAFEAGWVKAIGTLTSVMPFSVFELIICSLIIVGVYLIVRAELCACVGRFKPILNGLLAIGVGVMYILNLYIMTMGFGYYRSKMPLKQAGGDYNAHQAAVVAKYYLDDFNALAAAFERDENGCVVCPYTFSELASRIADEYGKLDDGYFFSYTPKAKGVINSWFLSDLLITGITFLPMGETALNIDAPPSSIPLTVAHELAHTKGVQREGDANLIAKYLLLASDDDYLRYCGYYSTFGIIAAAVDLAGDYDTFAEIARALDKRIKVEQQYSKKYWDAQPDIIGKIGEFFNNLYLEANGATNGTGSYNDGNQSSSEIPIDPSTGEPEKNPETGEVVVIPVYSKLQKVYFYIYEQKFGVPEATKKDA